jgi:hypothetical protein
MFRIETQPPFLDFKHDLYPLAGQRQFGSEIFGISIVNFGSALPERGSNL